MGLMLSVTLALLTQAATLSEQVAARVLAHPDLHERAAGHRLAAIRVARTDAADAKRAGKTVFSLVLFDHTLLEARRVTYDPATNKLLSNERLAGRPQRSDRELAEAISIVRRDPALARLLNAGAVLDGGFIVDDPGGSRRRMIQLKMMRPLRTILVDLSRGQIASVSDTHGGW